MQKQTNVRVESGAIKDYILIALLLLLSVFVQEDCARRTTSGPRIDSYLLKSSGRIAGSNVTCDNSAGSVMQRKLREGRTRLSDAVPSKGTCMNLYDEFRDLSSLHRAWNHIRSNGNKSILKETRQAIKIFDQNALDNLKRIRRLLHTHQFQFEPQKGVLKKKPDGKKRGIVMAAVPNRIVERALLECLQKKVPFVREVITTPTSVGGVPDRSVPHGLALIKEAIESKGYNNYIRSDYNWFF